jgi:hypothetical protein
MGKVIAKTWSDPAFKQKLLTDTAATLKAEGIEVPAGVQVRAVENTATLIYVVLPPKPAPGALSDEDLEKVAGGDPCSCLTICKHTI